MLSLSLFFFFLNGIFILFISLGLCGGGTREAETAREKRRRRRDLWQSSTDERLDIVRYINMRSECIAAGDGRGNEEKGQAKEKVWEREPGKDRYTASERLSLIDKLSLSSGSHQSMLWHGGAYTHTHTLARYCVCVCVCVCDGGEDVIAVCVLQESVCLKCRARQES